MNLAFLLPWGLIALGGLLVPLLIHLVRQSDNTIIDFPALRWLRESVRPRRRLRFEDRWLLLVRLLLVGLVALLVAMPVLEGSWRGTRHRIAVVPGVDIDAARQKISDTTAEWHWLAAGFPAIDEAEPRRGLALSSLLREFDASLPSDDSLSVIVPDQVRGLDAERILVGRAIEWIVLPSPPQSAVPDTPVERRLALRHSSAQDEGLGYLRAAVAAWDPVAATHWIVDDQPSTAGLPAKTDVLIWLGSPLPDEIETWVHKGGRALVIDDASAEGAVIWRDDQGATLARDEMLGNGHLIHLRGPLTAADFPILLDAEFPARLEQLLNPPLPAPSSAHADEIQPRQSTDPLPRFVQRTELVAWLGLLICLIFLIERWLATRRIRP
ncbi:MAG: BatA domain-containing protein [Xanthomonadales bacterium]|nr:BatA domain-containing protein [Xanthomonadales bacterium]